MQNNTPSTNSNKEKREYWFEHIKQWQQSTLSQKAYCIQADINHSTFTYWRGQFSSESGHSKRRQFLPVEITQPIAPEPSQLIKIKLLTGHVVCISGNVSMHDIATLIRQLEASHA